MKTQEIDTEYGIIKYSVVDDCIMIVEYRGRDISLTVPVSIEGKPVTIIGKKAFLAAKELKEIALPENINIIQDWAFASCRNLKVITLPKRKIEIGQGILKDCDKLSRIVPTEGDNKKDADTSYLPEKKYRIEDEVSFLLAAAMSRLDAFYLFNPQDAGSESWLEQWDAKMRSLMDSDDTEGFSKMLLCGEEDYGSRENNLDYYVEQRRRFKVRLAMLRLMHDIGLKTSVKNMLLTYLKSHTKGEESEETWRVVLEEHGDEREYYQFLLDNGCITKENIDAVLDDMGENHAEMKAYLINYRGTHFQNEDAFAALEFEI